MKKNIFAFFFVFSACFLFAAKNKMPEWITFPAGVYPAEKYMNGTGSGENRETAELEAVKNLSAVFGQTVKSNVAASKKMEKALSEEKVSFIATENLQQNITSQIEAENLIGIEIAEYFYNKPEKKWYAIAILEREKTAAIYQNYIERNDAAARQAIKESIKNPGTFYGYSEICFAVEIASENDKLLKNLTVIDFERGNGMSKKAVSIQDTQLAKKKFAEDISIYVKISGDKDNKIKSAFQDVFSSYGFKTSPSKKEKYSLEGSYSSEISRKGKITYCVYSLDLDFSDNLQAESLFAINLKGREGSPSESDAKNRTYRVLEKGIRTQFSKNFDSYIDNLSFN